MCLRIFRNPKWIIVYLGEDGKVLKNMREVRNVVVSKTLLVKIFPIRDNIFQINNSNVTKHRLR